MQLFPIGCLCGTDGRHSNPHTRRAGRCRTAPTICVSSSGGRERKKPTPFPPQKKRFAAAAGWNTPHTHWECTYSCTPEKPKTEPGRAEGSLLSHFLPPLIEGEVCYTHIRLGSVCAKLLTRVAHGRYGDVADGRDPLTAV